MLCGKSGPIELTDDDRDVFFGLRLRGAAMLQSDRRDEILTLWRQRGKRISALAAETGMSE